MNSITADPAAFPARLDAAQDTLVEQGVTQRAELGTFVPVGPAAAMPQ
jgi:hypothetical protein